MTPLFFNISISGMTDMGTACVRYQTQDNSYSALEAAPFIIINGDDVNSLLNSNIYESHNNYAVFEWSNNDYSIFNVINHVTLPYFDMSTADQKGRAFKIKKSPNGHCAL